MDFEFFLQKWMNNCNTHEISNYQCYLSKMAPFTATSSLPSISKLATTTTKKKKQNKTNKQTTTTWKYNLKEKLHAWFENEREQESAFGELKINQAWRVMYIPICFLSLSLGNFQLYYSIGYWPNPYHRSPLDTLPCSFHKIKRRTKSFKQFQK